MTQSPPDKMPDIFPDGHKFDTSTYLTAPEGSPRLITAEQWKEYQSLKATLADDLAEIEDLLTGLDGCLSHGANDFDEALKIIRRLRGSL